MYGRIIIQIWNNYLILDVSQCINFFELVFVVYFLPCFLRDLYIVSVVLKVQTFCPCRLDGKGKARILYEHVIEQRIPSF